MIIVRWRASATCVVEELCIPAEEDVTGGPVFDVPGLSAGTGVTAVLGDNSA